MPKIEKERRVARWCPAGLNGRRRELKAKANRNAILIWGDRFIESQSMGTSWKEMQRQNFAVGKIVEAGQALGWNSAEDVVVGVLAGRGEHDHDVEHKSCRDENERLKKQLASLQEEMQDMKGRISKLERKETSKDNRTQESNLETNASSSRLNSHTLESPAKSLSQAVEQQKSAPQVNTEQKTDEKGKSKAVPGGKGIGCTPVHNSSSESRPKLYESGEGGSGMIAQPGQTDTSSLPDRMAQMRGDIDSTVADCARGFEDKAITKDQNKLSSQAREALKHAHDNTGSSKKSIQALVVERMMFDSLNQLSHFESRTGSIFSPISSWVAKSSGGTEEKESTKNFALHLVNALNVLNRPGRSDKFRFGEMKKGIQHCVDDLLASLTRVFPTLDPHRPQFEDLYVKALQVVMWRHGEKIRAKFPELLKKDRKWDFLSVPESSRE